MLVAWSLVLAAVGLEAGRLGALVLVEVWTRAVYWGLVEVWTQAVYWRLASCPRGWEPGSVGVRTGAGVLLGAWCLVRSWH